MIMNKLLPFAALLEALFGLILFLFPSLIIKLLFGIDLSDLATVIGRLTRLGLLLCVNCVARKTT